MKWYLFIFAPGALLLYLLFPPLITKRFSSFIFLTAKYVAAVQGHSWVIDLRPGPFFLSSLASIYAKFMIHAQ